MSERVGGDKVRKFFKDRSERKSASEQARGWAGRLNKDASRNAMLRQENFYGGHEVRVLATLLETLSADNERLTKALETTRDALEAHEKAWAGTLKLHRAFAPCVFCDALDVARAALRPKEEA